MKTENFFGHKITKLIVGDNAMTGNSYVPDIYPREEMLEFYDSKTLYKTLWEIENAGFNCILPLATQLNIQMIKEYKRDGGKLNIIFQPYMGVTPEINIREMASVEPIGVYHQGTTTDRLGIDGRWDEIKALINDYKTMGIPVGIGTHYPDTIEKCEREEWDVDFYFACLHNTRRGKEREANGFITGKTKATTIFYQEDRPVMLDLISRVEKPCIAYKIFAGGQKVIKGTEEQIRENIKECYREVFSKIKPIDFACIGVYTKYKDQLNEDAELFNEVMKEFE